MKQGKIGRKDGGKMGGGREEKQREHRYVYFQTRCCYCLHTTRRYWRASSFDMIFADSLWLRCHLASLAVASVGVVYQ